MFNHHALLRAGFSHSLRWLRLLFFAFGAAGLLFGIATAVLPFGGLVPRLGAGGRVEETGQSLSGVAHQTAGNDLPFTLTLTRSVFLPIIASPPPVISGRVVQNGAPLAGATVWLQSIVPWFMHPSTVTTTVTDESGYYRFYNLTSTLNITAGVEYYRPVIHGELTWYAKAITYTAGTYHMYAPVDTTGITLIDPAAGNTISLPRLFTWTVRPDHPTDSYEVALFWAPGSLGTGPLGYTSSTIVPLSILQGNQFPYLDWHVRIHAPEGFGETYKQRIYFSWNTLCSDASRNIR